MFDEEFDDMRLGTGKLGGSVRDGDEHFNNIAVAISIFSEDKKGLDSMRLEPGKPHGGSWEE